MKILEIITEGLGYSTDPEQGKWYHEGRKAFKFGTTGNTIQDIAKKHGCPPEWLKAFHAGYQDQEGWGKGVSESKTQKAKAPKPPNFVAKHAMKTTSGAGAHTNAKKAAKDVRGQKHKAMAEGIVDVVKKKVSGLTGYKVKVSPDDQVWIAGTTTGYFTGSNSREREQQTLEKLSNELKKQGINTSSIKYTDMHDFTGDKYPPAWFIKVVKGQAETVLDMLKNNKIPGFAAASPSLSYPSGKSPTYRHSQDGLGGNPKESRKQGNTKHKKKEVAMEDASNQGAVISQEQLNQMYAKGKPMMFIKNTPVALVPLAKINQIGTPQQVQQVQKALGSVDQTSYTDEYKNKGYVVFQWNGTALDLYVASPEVVSQKYVKFNGQLPQDDKARGKIPSLVALSKLGIDPSKVPFFVKKVPTQMVSAKQLGLEGKTIQTSWGEQTVSPGGFMVREENGHIYTVAPDAKGLPIGYLPAQQGVKEGEPDYSVPGNWSAHSNLPPTKVLGSVYNTKGVYLGKWDGKRLIPDPNRDSVWHKWRDEQGDDWARNTIATAPQMIQQGRWTVKQDTVKGAVKEDGEGGASAGSTTSAMVGVGAVYKNKRAKKQKPGTNALDMKGVNLLTGGSIKR
jgi:hypothetical protein